MDRDDIHWKLQELYEKYSQAISAEEQKKIGNEILRLEKKLVELSIVEVFG